MKKKVDVYIYATVSKYIGEVECSSEDDFSNKAFELWESQGCNTPSFCHQCSVDTSDWDIDMNIAKMEFKE